jgi:hypothetical protein
MTLAEAGSAYQHALLQEGVDLYRQRLRDDARFCAEMAYCGPAGIPHSHFLGGPLTWTRDDQDKALAWQQSRREVCSGCGTFPDEWIDLETGRTVLEQPYVAEATHCWGCAEIEGHLAELRKNQGDLDGVTVRLRRFDPDRDEE